MICKNLESVKDRIAAAAEKACRDKNEIQLVAVSKKFPTEIIKEAINCNHHCFGENYIQEAQQKKKKLGDLAKIHFIGNLQSNKAKIAAQISTMVETVDRVKIANILNKEAGVLQKKLDILVQVNIGGEEQKYGIDAEEAEKLIAEINTMQNLNLRGLMAIPPFHLNSEETRPYFIKLRELSEKLIATRTLSKEQNELSMGMSGDFETAIEEGATIVRVGTAIFGKRPY